MAETFEWIARGLFLAEGPRADLSGDLYFGDVIGGGLYRCRPGAAMEAIDATRASVGGVVIDEGGGVLCSGRRGLMRYDPATGETRDVPVVIDGVALRNINELEADPAGNLWGGTLDYEAFEQGVAPKPSIVFRMTRHGTATRLAEMPIPNGMDFSVDSERLFLSESGEGVITYRITDEGTLADRRLFAAMPDSDGIVLDAAGGLWVARYLCDQLEYHDASGQLARSVTLPFPAVASVAFGGADLRDLYVAGGAIREPGQGGIIRMRVDTPGLPARLAAVPG